MVFGGGKAVFMAWQDRSYYRDPGESGFSRLLWVFNGSVPLFTVFGIRVRAHASLLLCMLLVLIFGFGFGFTWQERIISMGVLFTVVLLHEFGHCFAARYVGGDANDVLMTPHGGLAMANAPHRWGATLITVICGPLANVFICAGAGAFLWAMGFGVPWNPLMMHPLHHGIFSWLDVPRYVYQFYWVSYTLLVFNILPIWPLDGGQMLQCVLWSKLGYYRATMIACFVGIIGSLILLAVALPTLSLLLAFIAVSCLTNCINQRRMLRAMGPEEYADETDYSAAYEQPRAPKKRRNRISQRAIKKARKRALEARLEQERTDQILAKVSAHGMASLTWSERRALRKATEHIRKRDLEMSK
jgi:Zn-dependent protease